MGTLWLTYAWVDNQDQDVNHVIAELEATGLNVRYDRAELLAGRRLWQQLDAALKDPAIDAWAMLVTEDSLQSEPCQEEIAYALDRALRHGSMDFPLIGIFAGPIDPLLIPSAISTRLYVNLRSPTWAEDVADGVNGRKRQATISPPDPFAHKLHEVDGRKVLEVWPRSGRWHSFVCLVPTAELAKLMSVAHGPSGTLRTAAMIQVGDGQTDDGLLSGKAVFHPIDQLDTARAEFTEWPSQAVFGPEGGPMHVLTFGRRIDITTAWPFGPSR